MNNDKKKMSAAAAAVMMYLEEEAVAMQAPLPEAAQPVAAPAAMPSLWGASGRQSMMQMRSLMQLKAFHRL
jgi:Tfp pilus assembly protein FimV